MRTLICPLLALGLVLPLGADEPKQAQPKNLPVELKLTAVKASYKLDLGGLTQEELNKLLDQARKKAVKVPNPPAVELELEVKNVSDKAVQIWTSGDPVQVLLDLKGPGARTISPPVAITLEFRLPKLSPLEPGKSHKIEIKSLKGGMRGVGQWSYWTEAGEYTIAASFKTGISPPLPGIPAREGVSPVTLTSNTVKVKVE